MKQFIVDAFTNEVFHGNQAAVCVLDEWLDEELMMNITRENNFSETAFTVKEGDKYHLRWFTPGGEIDLCGHATLATAFILFNYFIPDAEKVVFTTLSGDLIVTRKDDLLEMEFPSFELKDVEVTDLMEEILGARPVKACIGGDLVCIMENEDVVRNLSPDFAKMVELDGLMVHVTAEGKDFDCVTRSFGPKLAVNEDPVCGRGHCHVTAFWAGEKGKDDLVCYQASKRGGTLYCRFAGSKVFLAGNAALFAEDELFI